MPCFLCGARLHGVLNSSLSAASLFPRNGRHLICDDSSLNRLLLRRILMKLLPIEVDEADCGAAVVKKVNEEGEYNIIWMDFALGEDEENGAEISQRLRDLHYCGVIIGLTGFSDENTQKMCMKNGMNHFMAKPFNSERIREYGERYSVPEAA